ncbi:MAG: glycosyltransferase [Salinivirgaceae bacterium]
MKVLMFGWEFPPNISGGLGTACQGMAKGLVSFNDINLTFVVPKAYGDENTQGMKFIGASEVELSHEIIAKQKYLEMSKFYEFNQHISAYTTPEQFEKTLFEQQEKLARTVRNASRGKLGFSGQYGNSLFAEISRYGVVASELARKEQFDVIHAHDWLTYPAGIEAKKVSGKPLVVHVHATEYDRCGENHNRQVYDIEQKGMAIADKVITVSDFTRNIVINKYKIPASRVVTVHNGVELTDNSSVKNLWKLGTTDKIVTFLGRITKQKGPEYFVKAAHLVLQKMDNVRFVMAGSGDLMQDMVKYAARLNISDKFHFTGFLKGNDVYRMYAMSDLYIMPSVSEPFGISPLEAMQCNVPVIISKQSGVSEVIKHAIKVDFWDVEALANAIYGVLNYTSLANHLKNYSKKEVNQLTWDKAAAKIKAVYYQVA